MCHDKRGALERPRDDGASRTVTAVVAEALLAVSLLGLLVRLSVAGMSLAAAVS